MYSAYNDSSVNLYFLLMSIIYVKILFSIGAFSDCLDIGYNVLNVLDEEKIQAIKFDNSIISVDEFRMLVSECVGYIALVDVITMKEDVGEFLTTANKLLPFLPQTYNIFVSLQNLIMGKPVNINELQSGEDMFSEIILHIINAFVRFKDKPNEFAQEIYKSKLFAKVTMIYPLELFADLMIGYAYIQLNSYRKASAIIYKIIKYTKLKGMNAIVHLAWYVMSILNIKQGKLDLAYGVLNNSDIQMEKNGVTSDYLTMLNKINMYKVLQNTGSIEQAQICIEQATHIAKKYGINFNLNVDNQDIMKDNAEVELEQNELDTIYPPDEDEKSPQPKEEDVVNPKEFFD